MDMAQALFDMELDDDFVERMDETAKLINEGKSDRPLIAEPTTQTQSAVKRKRQNVHFSRNEEEIEAEEVQKENNKDYVKPEVDKVGARMGE